MKLKNTYTKSTNVFERISMILTSHNVQKIMYNYNAKGQVIEITFSILVGENELGVKLPCKMERVERILHSQGYPSNEKTKEQSYRIAWANIRDWIDSQMALIDTQMVSMEEVFLPYIVDNKGVTLFERLQSSKFLLK